MIRKFKGEDMNPVINIWLEASVKAHDFVDREFWQSNVRDLKEIYIPSSKTFVYEDEEGIKGFFCLHQQTLAALFVRDRV